MDKHQRTNIIRDIILCGSLVIISLLVILIMNLVDAKDNLEAQIWYEDKMIKEIKLSGDNINTEVIYLHDDVYIIIEYKNNSIRVISSSCKGKDCVNQGWTSSVLKPIICMDLHYRIVINSNNNPYDVVVG